MCNTVYNLCFMWKMYLHVHSMVHFIATLKCIYLSLSGMSSFSAFYRRCVQTCVRDQVH